MVITYLKILGSSELITTIMKRIQAQKVELIPYHEQAARLLSQLKEVEIINAKRIANAQAYSLIGVAVSHTLRGRKLQDSIPAKKTTSTF